MELVQKIEEECIEGYIQVTKNVRDATRNYVHYKDRGKHFVSKNFQLLKLI